MATPINDLFVTIISYWTYAVFIVGIVAMTALILVFAFWAFDKVGKSALPNAKRIPMRFWMWRAYRAFNKVNPVPKAYRVNEPEQELSRMLNELIKAAYDEGYVVTITEKSVVPLAMGNTRMIPAIRKARHAPEKEIMALSDTEWHEKYNNMPQF